MKKNKTAVDYLWEQIPEILPFTVDTETGIKLYNAYQQAKEMHKEEIIKAAIYDPFLGDLPKQVGEQYYEDEFGENQE